MKGYKVFVKVFGEEKYVGNGLVFGTKEEAESYGSDLAGRWMAVQDWKVEEADDPVNYRWGEGKLQALAAEGGVQS